MFIDGRDYVNCDGTDETAGLREAFDASKNKRLVLPPSEIIVSSAPTSPAVTLSPIDSYVVEGHGHYPGKGTHIRDIGTGRTFHSDNSVDHAAGADMPIHFSQFCVLGNPNSGDGFFARYSSNTHLDRMWFLGQGGNGINMERCFNSRITSSYVTRAGRYGVRLHEQMNNFVIRDCRIIANSCLSGHANLRISSSPGNENYRLTIEATDTSYPGIAGAVSEAYGIVVTGTVGLTLDGWYCEQVAPFPTTYVAAYITDVNGLEMRGCYTLDGDIVFADGGMKNAHIGSNVIHSLERPAKIRVVAAPGDNVRYMDQARVGAGASQQFLGASVPL